MSKTIVALDFSSKDDVLNFLDKFQEPIYVKVGMELTYAFGFEMIKEIKSRGHHIFLDLKLHDIPNTVKNGMKNLASLGVDIVNLHAAGGSNMMKAAMEGLNEGAVDGKRPLCIAVTQLTSTSKEAMNNELCIPGEVKDCAIHYAKIAKESGLDGVVCSVHEAKAIHEACGNDFLTVTPGIRLASDSKDDQVRVATPQYAYEQGCDYIVVGRSITKAEDCIATYQFIEKTMQGEPTEKIIAKNLLEIKAVSLSPKEPFTWASGIKSPIYCDNRYVLSFPEKRDAVVKGFKEIIEKEFPEVDAIMGTATAGIPWAALVAPELNLPMGYVRSSNKDHGKGNKIEGKVEKGMKVVIIEDLISTGGSVKGVVEALKEAGCEVLGVAAIFSYLLPAATELFQSIDTKLVTLSNYDVLIDVAVEQNYVEADDLAKLKEWKKDPKDESWMTK